MRARVACAVRLRRAPLRGSGNPPPFVCAILFRASCLQCPPARKGDAYLWAIYQTASRDSRSATPTSSPQERRFAARPPIRATAAMRRLLHAPPFRAGAREARIHPPTIGRRAWERGPLRSKVGMADYLAGGPCPLERAVVRPRQSLPASRKPIVAGRGSRLIFPPYAATASR